MSGLLHIYHGEGKGKTTAAVGLTIRAAGQGKRILFAQFLKGSESGEIAILNSLKQVTVLRNQKDAGFVETMDAAEKEEVIQMHNKTLRKVWEKVKERAVDLVILDEVTYPYNWNMLERALVDELLENRPEFVELVITGRGPDPMFLEKADYITCMQCERHPYARGIPAREGIEY